MIPLRCSDLGFERVSAPGERVMLGGFGGEFQRSKLVAFRDDSMVVEPLMCLLARIDCPCKGRADWMGRDLASASDQEFTRHRDRSIGFLFSHPHLLPSFSVGENVAMPFFRLCGKGEEAASLRVAQVLDFSGLQLLGSESLECLGDEELWRLAFARAIVHDPGTLAAVSGPSSALLPLARRYAAERGALVLWAGEAAEAYADRVVELGEK